MKAIVLKSDLKGVVQAPPSKSYTHRAIVCGLLTSGITRIFNPLFCEDTEASLRISKMLGANIERGEDLTIIGPKRLLAPSSEMNCEGSGTTLRIFTALSALTKSRCVLSGNKSLQARPMSELLQALEQLGVHAISVSGDGRPPVEVNGRGLNGGSVRIRGDVSSQYISGLLFACSKAENDTKIELTTQLESKPYVEMTLEVMRHFGVSATPTKNWSQILIPGNQIYKESNYRVPGDYSSAAFLLVAGAIAGSVRITGLEQESTQGDSRILSLLKKMGVSLEFIKDEIRINRSELISLEIDVSQIPDLVPILAVLASQAEGRTRIFNASRLQLKESNRLISTQDELRKMGAEISTTGDEMIIDGPTPLHGAVIDSHQDHRIAMACTVAGIVADGPTIIEGVDCVSKSYPDFIEHMSSLGAAVDIEQTSKQRRKNE
ncbi:MAG: 3-phosphoshikimate 1-carboxyvinyltransferase [Candidatus Thorarchaeota archaeon]